MSLGTPACKKEYIYIYIGAVVSALRLPNISNCSTKILATCQGLFIIFCCISKYLCIYSTVSVGTPNSVIVEPC
jgi:hypothetical protein